MRMTQPRVFRLRATQCYGVRGRFSWLKVNVIPPDCQANAGTVLNPHKRWLAGWRRATRVCLGIALANGLFITAAFSGITLFRAGSLSFIAIQLTGCAYLLYIGQLFIRPACCCDSPLPRYELLSG